MKFDVILTPEFERAFKSLAKRHRSLTKDILIFIKSLEENPFQGTELCPGVRKIRMAITSKGRGKSGGARVITFTTMASEDNGTIYLIDIYDKPDYDSVDVAILQKHMKDIGLLD